MHEFRVSEKSVHQNADSNLNHRSGLSCAWSHDHIFLGRFSYRVCGSSSDQVTRVSLFQFDPFA